MAGRYGPDDVQTARPQYQKSAHDVHVRTSRVDYSGVARGIIGALDGIKTISDHRAKQKALIDSMGLGAIIRPGPDDKYTRTLEHMNGRASMIQFKTDMAAESAKHQDLPDEQYDATMHNWKMKYFKDKSKPYVMGLIAAGGIDAEDQILAKRHEVQRVRLADTWTSGAKQRTDGLLSEDPTVDTLMVHMAQEQTMGTDYYSDPAVTRAKVYESVSNWAKSQEGVKAKQAYELLKEFVNTPSKRPEDNGQRLKDTGLNHAIMNDLKYLKKKAEAGVSGQVYMDTKGFKTQAGAPDMKRIEDHLDSEMKAGNITLAQRNTIVNTHISDYQTKVQQKKQQLSLVTENVVQQISSMMIKKDYKGAMDEILKHPEADPITLAALQRTIEGDMKRSTAGSKTEGDAVRETAVVQLLMDARNNPLMDLNDGITKLESKGVTMDFDTLKLVSSSFKILQSSVKKSYERVLNQINGRFGYKPDQGFTVPNQRAALKTTLYFNEYIQQKLDAGEEINWTEIEEGIDKPGHFLFEVIKDNQPGLQDSMNELISHMGVSKRKRGRWSRDTPDRWKVDLDKVLKTYKGVPVSVDLLTAYIRQNRPNTTDEELKRMLTTPDRRDQIVTAYIKENN